MAIVKNVGRQEVLAGYIDIPFTELTVAGEFEIMNLPYGAMIAAGSVAAKSLTGVTDVTVAVDDAEGVELIADMSGTYAASGAVPIVPDGTVLGVPGYVKIVTTGNASAGELRVYLSYIVDGRACVSEG